MYKNLNQLSRKDSTVFGTKASNLGTLVNNNFPVPEGYALSTLFYDNFEYDLQNKKAQDILQKIYKSLMVDGTTELAIRSSSLSEDSKEFSMAGVFESYIGIKSFKEMVIAVSNCYISLHSMKARSLYLENKIPKSKIKMAVIIQSFKRGDFSGVLFTVDPSKSNKDNFVIGTTEGICDDFVSGKKETKRFVSDRKSVEFDDLRLKELYHSALKIEKLFDSPQDIEWTYAENQLWILQARPITNLKLTPLKIDWTKPSDAKQSWDKFVEDVKPLNQEIAIKNHEAYNLGCEISGFDFYYGETISFGNALFVRDKELKDSKTKQIEYSEYLTKLRKENKNVFIDIVLPEILKLQKTVEPFIKKEKSGYIFNSDELVEYIDKGLDYQNQVSAYHWQIVQGCLEADSLELLKNQYGLTTQESLALISSETLLGKQRRKFQKIVDFVKNDKEAKKLFNENKYSNLLWNEISENELYSDLFNLLKNQLNEYGLDQISWDSVEILEEKPEHLINYLIYSLTIEDNNVSRPKLDKKDVFERVVGKLDVDTRREFERDIEYYKKAYLVRDDHAFYIDSGAGGYLRKAIILSGKYLVKKGLFSEYRDIEYFSLDEIKELLINPIQNDLEKRKEDWKNDYIIPPFIGVEPPPQNSLNDSKKQGKKEDSLTGLAGFTGTIKGLAVTVENIGDYEGGGFDTTFQ